MPKISVIIPVYNVSDYINDCISSLLNQTFTDFELILVEDCSKDDSLAKCEQIVEKDNRVRLVKNKVNKGAAVSRNTGFTYATGKYVIFLDSDDYFYPEMLEACYNIAEKYNVDVVTFGYHYHIQGAEKIKENEIYYRYKENKLLVYSEVTAYDIQSNHVPWNKLVKRSLVLDNYIEFQDIPNSNDVYFSLKTLLSAKSIFYSDKILINYITHNDNLSSGRMDRRTYAFVAYYEVLKYVLDNCKDRPNIITGIIDYIFKSFTNYMFLNKYSDRYKEDIYNDFKPIINLIKLNKCEDIKLGEYTIAVLDYILSGNNPININRYKYMVLYKIKNLKNKKIALWGCGQYGKLLIDALEDNDVKIDYVVDSDESIQNTFYKSYKIQKYESIKDDIDIVLVTNMKFYDEISEMAQGKEVIYIE